MSVVYTVVYRVYDKKSSVLYTLSQMLVKVIPDGLETKHGTG